MAHEHNTYEQFNKAFAIGIALNVAYILIEAIYGIIINSLALISDAGHNLSDVLGLLLAWGAGVLTQKAPTTKRTYGLRKSSILAALFNAVILLIAMGAIGFEAITRFSQPKNIEGSVIIWVAGIGVIVNAVTALLFVKGRQKDINIRAAFLHMAADAGVSLGVVAGGIIILNTNWNWVDPVLSILIVLIIIIGTWDLLKDSFNLAMDAVPPEISAREVETYFSQLPGVVEVHDLHIWAMSTTETALTVHLVMPEQSTDDKFLKKICGEIHNKFGIEHPTIQVEKEAQSANCNIDKI